MDSRPVGIFDSGIGGLTVLKEIRAQLPNENFIYFGDTKNFPYGEKTKEEIINFSRKNIKYLIEQNVKTIVIACGTATSQSLDIMKKEFSTHIIGIIEPTVEFVKKRNIKKIGVIATTGTIKNGAWERNLKEKNENIEVINQECPLLANIAEEGKIKSKESIEAIHKYMQIFKDNKVDTLILGCTHYPIYDEILKKEFQYKISLINTGIPIAEELKRYLYKNNIENDNKCTENMPKIIISKEEEGFETKAKNILKLSKKLDITILN